LSPGPGASPSAAGATAAANAHAANNGPPAHCGLFQPTNALPLICPRYGMRLVFAGKGSYVNIVVRAVFVLLIIPPAAIIGALFVWAAI
jgi:hypothetical protein